MYTVARLYAAREAQAGKSPGEGHKKIVLDQPRGVRAKVLIRTRSTVFDSSRYDIYDRLIQAITYYCKVHTNHASRDSQFRTAIPSRSSQRIPVSAVADRSARRAASRPYCCTHRWTLKCDKLVTDDRRQFITLSVHLS